MAVFGCSPSPYTGAVVVVEEEEWNQRGLGPADRFGDDLRADAHERQPTAGMR